jgi:hypothetical protein
MCRQAMSGPSGPKVPAANINGIGGEGSSDDVSDTTLAEQGALNGVHFQMDALAIGTISTSP